MPFNAILINNQPDFTVEPVSLSKKQLPHNAEVLVEIAYSTINYKDALALTNTAPIIRQWPMVPGIDGVGIVKASAHNEWQIGDHVVLNGWGVGESHWGCLAQYAQLKSEWLIPLKNDISMKHAMALGTAGYTAALCVLALEDAGLKPSQGEVLVTGASGGVGSIAIMLLAQRGYRVVAVTGKTNEHAYITQLGANEILDRALFSSAGKPLQKERWAGVVDVAGSHMLANACAQTQANGIVTACGLAQNMDFPSSVAPFILRGIKLIGINSVTAPRLLRERAWNDLSVHIDRAKLDTITTEISLAESIPAAQALLAGQLTGRIRVDVNR